MLNPAHGGALVELVEAERIHELKTRARDLPSWNLTPRQVCDLELLLNGGFSPLRGFLTKADYESVVQTMRLADGTVWPIPVMLDVDAQFADALHRGGEVVLRDPEGAPLALLRVEEVWQYDRQAEAQQVYGSLDPSHPGVRHTLREANPVYLGGRVLGIELPAHFDFSSLRHTPRALRAEFASRGWRRVVAFQTRNPMHRAHLELVLRAARQSDASLLIHPVVGMTKPGDVDYLTRMRCYQRVLQRLPGQQSFLSALPLAMRMAGPREALWHALIRKNYGCTHFIVGRDHAGPGSDANGNAFYPPYAAQELVARFEDEIGVTMVPFEEMVYVREFDDYRPASEVLPTHTVLNLSEADLHRRLREGEDIPQWFSYPEVVQELRRGFPPKHKQGFTVFFTGLSGSGKSTIARALLAKLMEIGTRSVTLLDGDLVRKHLSSELGFSREHRDLNIARIGFVASEITKHGGIAVCAPIAPYAATRALVRSMISEHGGFIEVYVSTPLEVCEARDRKGLYAKARAGQIKTFTGISDPYEVPERPEVLIDTSRTTPAQAAEQVLAHLREQGYWRPGASC